MAILYLRLIILLYIDDVLCYKF